MANPQKYNILTRILHWLNFIYLALIFIPILILFINPKLLGPEGPEGFGLIYLYFLPVAGFIGIIQLIVRKFSKSPDYPAYYSAAEKRFARGMQYALYFFLILSSFSLYFANLANCIYSSPRITFFNKFVMLIKNDLLRDIFYYIHCGATVILVALIILHICNVIKRLIVNKDNLFKRIL